jgi:GntR family transcriptional regulator / MocR family aminotransferase
MAHDLAVARGTVSAAYGQLAAEGYLETRQGAPVRVSRHPRLQAQRARSLTVLAPAGRLQWDFRPGRPESTSFPRADWLRACRKAIARTPDDVFGYGDGSGSVRLRNVLADYLGRSRGVDTDPEHLLVCSGFTQALTLICRVLRMAGRSSMAIEDPCAPRYRQIVQAAGLSVVPVPCDQDGLVVDELERSDATAVLVTPAHQFPLGVTMTAARRTALIEWARRREGLIIEDDYDGEFRYDRQPLGALQRLDPDRVIYAGTASKTLAPGLRLGWLSPPSRVLDALTDAKDETDRGTGILEQLTFAEFIASGAFDRHIRRMRTRYRRRRDALAQVISESRPDLQLAGIAAGLHAVVYMAGDKPAEDQIKAQAAERSIALHTRGEYRQTQPRAASPAIIVGYAAPASHAYRPALHALAALLAAL